MTDPDLAPSPPASRLVLASASPARLTLLRAAGFDPIVLPSGVDEGGVAGLSPAETAQALAERKADAVAARILAERTGLSASGPDDGAIGAAPAGPRADAGRCDADHERRLTTPRDLA